MEYSIRCLPKRPVNLYRPLGLFVAAAVGCVGCAQAPFMVFVRCFQGVILVCVLFQIHGCIGMVCWLMFNIDGLLPLFLWCSMNDVTLS